MTGRCVDLPKRFRAFCFGPFSVLGGFMEYKGFTTFEQQIEILRDRNLLFSSEEVAIKCLNIHPEDQEYLDKFLQLPKRH